MTKKLLFTLFKRKRNLIAKISSCTLVMLLIYEFKTFLTSGNETKCWIEMKKGSTDELEVTVKPTMTGRHSLEIRILDRVVVHKEFESKPGKCSVNVFTYMVYRHLLILQRSIQFNQIQIFYKSTKVIIFDIMICI